MNRKHLLLVTLLILLVSLTAVACGSKEKTVTYTTLDVKTAYTRFNETQNALLVDVRTPEEWAATGIVPGATLITLSDIEQRAATDLPKDDTIFVICNSGNRSKVAAEALIKLGYKHVINIDGGMQAWLQANLPTTPYTP